MKLPAVAEWLEAVEAAATEVLTRGVGDPPEFDPRHVDLTVDEPGVYVSLVGPVYRVRMGIVGARDTLRRLAGAAAMVEPSLSETEDAACDLIHAIGGAAQKFLDTRSDRLVLGVPVFSPRPLPLGDCIVGGTEVSFAGMRAKLVVMLPGALSFN